MLNAARWTWLFVFAALLLPLAACGGGGGEGASEGSGDPVANAPDVPPSRPPSDDASGTTPGGDTQDGGTQDGGTEDDGTEDDGSEDDGSEDDGSEGDEGTGDDGTGDGSGGEEPPQTLPQPPPLPTWDGLPDVRALAVDPDTGYRYAASAATGELFRIDPAEEVAMPIAALPELIGVRGLAWGGPDSRLYALVQPDGLPDYELVSVLPEPLEVARQGPVEGGLGGAEGLAFRASDGLLYTVGSFPDPVTGVIAIRLVKIDPQTRAVALVGAVGDGIGAITGIAADNEEDQLYGIDSDHAALVELDLNTGQARKVSDLAAQDGLAFVGGIRRFLGADATAGLVSEFDPMGSRYPFTDILGLTYDPQAETYYGVHTVYGAILAIDPATGWRQLIAYGGVPGLEGLAYAPGRVYAVSTATKTLYVFNPADDPLLLTPLQQEGDTTEPDSRPTLSSLAFANGLLFATDPDQPRLLSIDPATGVAIPVATAHGHEGLRSLAYDPDTGLLHAFSDGSRTHVTFDPGNAFAVGVVEPSGDDPAEAPGAIGGLAWRPDAGQLVGSDRDRDALVVLYGKASDDESAAIGDIRALAQSPFELGPPDPLLGFEVNGERFVAIDRFTQTVTPVADLPGARIEALAADPAQGRVYGVDNVSGTLYVLGADLRPVPVGAPGTLQHFAIRALAFDEGHNVLVGIHSDPVALPHQLVLIDPSNGAALPVPEEWPPLPGEYQSIEAMTYDTATGVGVFVAIDRDTRALLEISPTTGHVEHIAEIEVGAAAGVVSTSADQMLLAVDPDRGQVLVFDRFTGRLLEDIPPASRTRGAGSEATAMTWWPRGEVRLDGLEHFLIEAGLNYAGTGRLVWRRGEETLHEEAFEPELTHTYAKIPPAVRTKLAVGDVITWGLVIGDGETATSHTATFTVVDIPEAAAEAKALAANPYLKKQAPLVRAVRDARVLERHGLYAQALELFLRLHAEYPEDPVVIREAIRAFRSLDLAPALEADVLSLASRMGATGKEDAESE